MARSLIECRLLLREAVLVATLVGSLHALPASAQEAGSGSDAAVAPVDDAPPVAAPPPPAATALPTEVPHDEAPKHKQAEEKKKNKRKKKKKLTFGGRVIVRGTVEKVDPATEWRGNQSIDSARVRADYDTGALRAQISVELAPKPRIKNAFVELRVVDDDPRLTVRAGRFKMPISGIELASRWTLPMADRGLLHTVLVDRYQIAGRTVGAMGSLVHKPSHLRVDAGVFQGSDDAGNPLAVTASDRFGQDLVARASLRPARGVELAIAAQARVGALNIDAPPIIRRGRAGEFDATLERDAGPGVVRAWLEGMVGTSWLVGRTLPCSGYRPCKALFLAGRAIAAYRVGGRERKEHYGEIYAIAGALDPDRDTRDDRIIEAGAGLTYGAWEVWRVQAGFDVWRFGAAAPLGIESFASAPADSVRFLVQLAARL